jgi:transporter family protein
MWILFGLLAAVFAALVAVFGKIGLEKIDPTLATTIRVIIMFVIMLIVSFAFKKWSLLHQFDTKAWYYIFASAAAGSLSWLFYFMALKLGPATKVAALDRMSVVFVFILAAIFLAEKATWQTGIGAALVATGGILMVI